MVVRADLPLQFREPRGQPGLPHDPLPKPQERPHHEDAHLRSPPAVEHRGGPHFRCSPRFKITNCDLRRRRPQASTVYPALTSQKYVLLFLTQRQW